MKSGKLSRFIAVGVLFGAIGSGAFANDKSPGVQGDFCQHAKTRAQVIEELDEARTRGLLSYNEADFPRMPKFVSTKTRAEVTADLYQARAQGLISSTEADFPKMPKFASTTTRAQVIAELNQAQSQGLLTYTEADFPKMPISPKCG